MRKYTTLHERNIVSEAQTNRTKLEPGDIIRFNYTGKDVHVDRPLVFVLHPDYDGKLHAISLDYISEPVLIKLSKIVKDKITARIQKLIRIRLPMLKPDIGRPYDFYHQQLNFHYLIYQLYLDYCSYRKCSNWLRLIVFF